MMILTSELHQVLTHLFHIRAAVDFEQVPACPLPNWAMRQAYTQAKGRREGTKGYVLFVTSNTAYPLPNCARGQAI